MENWAQELNIAITVADNDAVVIDMNDKSAKTFEKSGGEDLKGKSLFDCHPEAANEKIRQLLSEQSSNAYTIEKNGIKKLIYQTPWYEEGVCKGLVEISIVLPENMPHFVRK